MDLIAKSNSTRRTARRGIRRLLKAKSVSDAIKGYQERVRVIKEDFLVRFETFTNLFMYLHELVDRFTRPSTRISLFQKSKMD